MKLSDYIRSLDQTELNAYAARCNSTPVYIATHLLHARKEPRKALREALASESRGSVSMLDVLEHFGMSGQPVT